MSSLRISRFRIKTISGPQVIVGGFGDVVQAKLRTSLFGPSLLVALKKLRPAGDREQRIRVIAVSMDVGVMTNERLIRATRRHLRENSAFGAN